MSISCCVILKFGRSLERILQYLTIEQEPKSTVDGVPPAYWPASGALKVENLSARYSTVSVMNILDMAVLMSHAVGIGWSLRVARHII